MVLYLVFYKQRLQRQSLSVPLFFFCFTEAIDFFPILIFPFHFGRLVSPLFTTFITLSCLTLFASFLSYKHVENDHRANN
jgi:hypothetical protein